MLENGVWYREVAGRADTMERQVLLPEALRQEALRVVHDHLWAGHQGIKNTQKRLEARFF